MTTPERTAPGQAIHPWPVSRLTAVFTKRPVAGRVKTRLAQCLGAERAAQLAEAMLGDVLERCAGSSEFRTALWFAPAEDRAWFEERFPSIELVPQEGDDLAQRLAEAFRRGLGRPEVKSMVVVGSDQPLLATARIRDAHLELEAGADLVLAPDPGGGYALVGSRAPHPELFLRVEMSTPGMCAATLALAKRLGLESRCLPEELDVDVEADLVRLRHELGILGAHAPRAPEYPQRTALFLERNRGSEDGMNRT